MEIATQKYYAEEQKYSKKNHKNYNKLPVTESCFSKWLKAIELY